MSKADIKDHQFKPGESGNPEGRPPGIKNWATLVQQLLDDTALAEKLLSKKPGWWGNLPSKNAGHAIVVAMMISAMNGDVKAATWLRRTGYGDKLDLTSDGKRVKSVAIFDMRSGQPMTLAPLVAPKPKAKPKRKPAAKTSKSAKKKPANVNKKGKPVDKPKPKVNKKPAPAKVSKSTPLKKPAAKPKAKK